MRVPAGASPTGGEHLERLHRGSSTFISSDEPFGFAHHLPAHRVGRQATSLTLTICCLMLLLNSVLVHVGIVRIHPADVVESGGEERGVLVAVPGVSVGGLNRGALVDCEVGDHAEIMKEKCEREEVRVQKMDESGRAGRRPQRAS